MSARSSFPEYKGKRFDGNFSNFQQWGMELGNNISQPLFYESPDLKPANQKFWSAAAMAHMQYLDVIPSCQEGDWDQWDMQKLINDTNAKTPGRISPAMEAQLLKVELDLGEHCQHWKFVQQTLFTQLNQALENKTVLFSIDISSDSFPFSRAMKILRTQICPSSSKAIALKSKIFPTSSIL